MRWSSTSTRRWRTRCSRRGTRWRGGSSAAASSTPPPARTSRCSNSRPPRCPSAGTRSTASRPRSARSPPASTRSRLRSPRSPPFPHPPPDLPRLPPSTTPACFSSRPRHQPLCWASTRSSASFCGRTWGSRSPTRSGPTTGSRGAPSLWTYPAVAWLRPSVFSGSSSCSLSPGTEWTSRWSRSPRRSGSSCPIRSAVAVAELTERCYCILYNTRPFWRTIIFNEDERHHNGDMPFPRPSCLLLGNKIVKTEEGYNYTVS